MEGNNVSLNQEYFLEYKVSVLLIPPYPTDNEICIDELINDPFLGKEPKPGRVPPSSPEKKPKW